MRSDPTQLIPMNGEVRGTIYWTYGIDHHQRSREGWFHRAATNPGLIRSRKVGGRNVVACTTDDAVTLFVPYVKAAQS